MSTLVSLTQDASAQLLLAQAADVTLAAGEGFLDWGTAKNTQTQALFRGVSITVAIIFVIWQAIASRMAMARIIIAGVTAGILVWVVWNVTNLKDRVDNEVNAMPAVVQTTDRGGVSV